MTELDLIIDLHKNTERQGPGSESDIKRALECMNLSNDTELNIADIGCGSGGQTLRLAHHLNGKIIAVDLCSKFLQELDIKSEQMGFEERISTLEKPMDALPFQKSEFDIIWSEGAIYNIGFEAGIKQWKEYLKQGGYIAVSDITWISDSRPQEIETFWHHECPDIGMASTKIKVLEDNGLTLTGYFYLSENSWINYYHPLEIKFERFLNHHNHSELAKKVVAEYKDEIEMYHKFKNYYSYGFYIAKKS
ncbi:MAG: class I SAM-dependent methyltransferase [Saprospiraceae bacterium]|nr:class I SAM-dependent methyltransferase [Saprospiraceae bacterium]